MSSQFICPVCGKKFNYWIGLKLHFKQNHVGDTCVVCGKKINVKRRSSYVLHAFRVSLNDDEHKILYALVSSCRKGAHAKKIYYRECTNFAMRELTEGGIRWGNDK